jgi:hypothetical protein
MNRVRAGLGLIALLAVGCGSSSGSVMKELQRVKVGDITVVVLSDDAEVTQGKDAVTLEFRGPDDQLRDVGSVKAAATMPMAGMAPMLGNVQVTPDAPGRYRLATDLGMSGGWQIALDWEGPAGKGGTRFQQPVR